MNSSAPHSVTAEQAVLGAVLLSEKVLPTLAVDEGLRSEHFYRESHGEMFAAMLRLSDRRDPVDPVTLAAELGGDPAAIDSLAGAVPAAGNARAYARRVIDLAKWRARRSAGLLLLEAAAGEDQEKVSEAEGLLSQTVARSRSTFSVQQLADRAWERLKGGKREAFPLPFNKLTDLAGGGLRRGEVTLVGGWTSHGKSVLIDQLLEGCVKRGLKVHLYINEMTPDERVDRIIARWAGVSFKKLRLGVLDDTDMALAVDQLDKLPFGVTDCAGWSADDLSRHIRWHGWDIAGIDILHLIDHREERDLAAISRTLNHTAKPSQGNCAIVATVHLNENRITSATRPRPTLGDIRGSGMLKNDADSVLFVFRVQDNNALPTEEAFVYFAKNRNGELGGVEATFNPHRMRFEAAA